MLLKFNVDYTYLNLIWVKCY